MGVTHSFSSPHSQQNPSIQAVANAGMTSVRGCFLFFLLSPLLSFFFLLKFVVGV